MQPVPVSLCPTLLCGVFFLCVKILEMIPIMMQSSVFQDGDFCSLATVQCPSLGRISLQLYSLRFHHVYKHNLFFYVEALTDAEGLWSCIMFSSVCACLLGPSCWSPLCPIHKAYTAFSSHTPACLSRSLACFPSKSN